MNCILCDSKNVEPVGNGPVLKNYFICSVCDLRFLSPELRLSFDQEKERYMQHNNDIQDPRYQNFVRPICDEVTSRCNAGAMGLDFGSGSGPVVAKLLREAGMNVSVYDPIFSPDTSVLDTRYDFLTATEVIEHFYNPRFEFERFRTLVSRGGLIALMTLLYEPRIDFENWYYRKDPTHVAFYSRQTFEWISKALCFSSLNFVGERMILMRV